jgi:hypothetical protein
LKKEKPGKYIAGTQSMKTGVAIISFVFFEYYPKNLNLFNVASSVPIVNVQKHYYLKTLYK